MINNYNIPDSIIKQLIKSSNREIPFDSKTKEIINQEKKECTYLKKIFKENM